MQRFFLPGVPLAIGETVDLAPLAHQLHTVLRLALGDQICLLDGEGWAYPAQILTLDRRRAAGLVQDRIPVTAEPVCRLTLYQCTLKLDKFEWILQKGTELGVSRFVPVVSQRSVVRPIQAVARKQARWQTIIQEAAEQCGRGRLPELSTPLTLQQALTQEQAPRCMAWEEGAGQNEIPSVHQWVGEMAQPSAMALLIGPEGGFDPAEAAQAQAEGWRFVHLGPRILRAETAALAGVTLILGNLGELGGRASAA